MNEEMSLSELYSETEKYLKQRDYGLAKELAWQQLDMDPLYEPAVKQLMMALAQSGQRSAALAQYEIYSKRLQASLSVEPSAELNKLYRTIQADELQQTALRSRIQIPDATDVVNPIFCYTDIENSTRLWDEHREAMFVALLQHNDLCEREIERFQGRILTPTGDGFLIVFEQNDPLQFAINLQQKIAAADWGEIGELRIRIGLHGTTAGQEGHEFFREGAWYRGSILNHAARIADTGHGGQIVASSFVREQCPLPQGASWVDLGQHALKSLDEKQQILGLMHPALPRKEFPPLRTLDTKQAAQAEGKIRGYQLGQKIGQGAFGDVYQAVQPGIGRPVAVKIIRSLYANQPEFIRRFEAEAQVIARLEHPNIVPLYDYWREADGAFLVMRYMRGGSLRSLLEEGPLDLRTTLAYLDQIAAGLSFSHQQGYVHRDIKPANILLDEVGNAYLSDFGLVKNLSGEDQLTQTGAIVGSPAYFSPEQAAGRPVTPLSDQYSLALVLFEMLTGARAFDDISPATLIFKQVNEPLPLVRASRPELPLAVDECIQRAAAKDPGARFADIPAMMRALHVGTRTDSSSYPLPAELLASDQELVNPYHGLRSFQEADAASFFGRRAMVDKLLTHFADGRAPLGLREHQSPGERFLAIVGPSGSGKSSVVRAGLIPGLRRGAVPGSEDWFIVEMIPGTHPLEELEAALLRIAINPPDSLLRQLQEDERGLLRAVKRVLPADGSELLLFIDQFEELYTLVEDDGRRAHFINSLLAALHDAHSRLRVVITVRADFYDRPLMTPGLAEMVQSYTEVVPPLTRVELEEAIVQPTLQVGALFEAGLVPQIIDDVSEEPGALPLLQYALTELFERRQERLLTRAAYDEIGGVLGALGRRAEELYLALDDEGQGAARQLFLRLVTLGEGTEDTRRRVLRSEVMALQSSKVSKTSEVLDAYGRYRLLTFDRDPLTREPTVEVAHEALLRDWPRLRGWLDESRDDLRLQRRLAAATAEWVHAEQSDDYLLHGSRLDLFIGWFANTELALTWEEQAFLDASEAARQQRQAQEDTRRRRELETAQRLAQEQQQRAEEQEAAAHGLRRRALFLGAALVVAAILAIAAVFFANQSNRNAQAAVIEANQRATAQALAETESESRATAQAQAEANEVVAVAQQATAEAEAQIRATAEAQTAVERDRALQAQAESEHQSALTTSRELALAGLLNLDKDPELSILLALEALKVLHTNEAEELLHKAIQTSRVVDGFLPHEGHTIGAEYSPDGRFLAVYTDGLVKVWDVETGQEQLTFTGHKDDWVIGPDDNWVELLAFTPDGSRLASVGENGMLRIWDAQSGRELLAIEAEFGTDFDNSSRGLSVGGLAFNHDGTQVARGFADGSARIWDAATGEVLFSVTGHDTEPDPNLYFGVADIEFSPDGSRLITTSMGAHPEAIVWDFTSGERLFTLTGHLRNITQGRFAPDGSLIATTSKDMTRIWDANTGELLHILGEGGSDLSFTPDGTQLATVGEDYTARFWDVTSGIELFSLSGPEGINSIDISPDGSRAVTVAQGGYVRFWDIGPAHESLTFDVGYPWLTKVTYSPDGQFLATLGGEDGTAHIWDAATGQKLLTLEGHEEWVGDIVYNSDGSQLATASDDGTAKIWDAATGETLQTFAGHDDWVNMVAISPDDTLLATAGQDRKVIIWDIASGEIVHTLEPFEDSIWSIKFSPDGSRLATGVADLDPRVRIWDVQNGQEVLSLEGHEGTVNDLAYSPDGDRLLTTSVDGTARLWDANSGEELFVMNARSDMRSGAFSPDGETIATGELDSVITIWDAATGTKRITLLENAGGGISHVEYSPDGSHVITNIPPIGRVIEFVLPLDELVAIAESRVTRALTNEECRQYLHLGTCPN